MALTVTAAMLARLDAMEDQLSILGKTVKSKVSLRAVNALRLIIEDIAENLEVGQASLETRMAVVEARLGL